MWKLQPPEKSHPPLSQQPPSEIWDPIVDCQGPHFENLVRGSTPLPPAERGRVGAYYDIIYSIKISLFGSCYNKLKLSS